jgi:hypothetical protein
LRGVRTFRIERTTPFNQVGDIIQIVTTRPSYAGINFCQLAEPSIGEHPPAFVLF